jgi:hypothetical protein
MDTAGSSVTSKRHSDDLDGLILDSFHLLGVKQKNIRCLYQGKNGIRICSKPVKPPGPITDELIPPIEQDTLEAPPVIEAL